MVFFGIRILSRLRLCVRMASLPSVCDNARRQERLRGQSTGARHCRMAETSRCARRGCAGGSARGKGDEIFNRSGRLGAFRWKHPGWRVPRARQNCSRATVAIRQQRSRSRGMSLDGALCRPNAILRPVPEPRSVPRPAAAVCPQIVPGVQEPVLDRRAVRGFQAQTASRPG